MFNQLFLETNKVVKKMKSKVSLIQCNSYRTRDVYDAVKRSVDLLGGISSVVKPGNRVLIKPNLLSAKPPESGIDTHPEVVRAVVRLVKETGGIAEVGDSPGGSVKKMAEVYATSGIKQVCEEENVKIVNFDKVKTMKGIPVATAPLSADVFISLPKFKTHSLMTLTGAVKNVFGIVPGLFKTECHKLAPNPAAFAKLLVDIYSYAQPHLSILDGIVGMEGDGPASGGILRKINLIAASTDAVSMDAVMSRIMGIEPFDIFTTREADRRGLGTGRIEDIEVVGDDLNRFIQPGFKLPRTTLYHRLPNSFMRFMSLFLKVRPGVNPDRCKNCGLCVRSCPVEAISSEKGKIKFDYSKCILCLCCHEFCPENAIFIKENIIARIIRT